VLLLRTTLLLAFALFVAELPALPTAVKWSVAVSAPADSPVMSGDQIFVSLQSGVVAAHRASDGGETWRVELRADQPLAFEGTHVFVAANEAVHALDGATGAVAWVAPTGSVTAPLLAQDGWVIAAAEGAGIAAFRAADGQKMWARDLSAQHTRPSIEGNTLYVPLDDGHLHALDLQSGADRWTRHLPGAPSEVLAFSDRIYLGAAKLFYCIDADDGAYEWSPRLGALLRGRPAAEGTRIFVTSIDNMLRAYDRNSGALLWHRSVPFRPTAPVVVGTTVVVPGNSAELLAFDVATGRPAGQIKLPDILVMRPAFSTTNDAPVMTAFTGSIKSEWKLVLTAPAPPAALPASSSPGASPPRE
jgi:outer membrane protein assembly factor BamB